MLLLRNNKLLVAPVYGGGYHLSKGIIESPGYYGCEDYHDPETDTPVKLEVTLRGLDENLCDNCRTAPQNQDKWHDFTGEYAYSSRWSEVNIDGVYELEHNTPNASSYTYQDEGGETTYGKLKAHRNSTCSNLIATKNMKCIYINVWHQDFNPYCGIAIRIYDLGEGGWDTYRIAIQNTYSPSSGRCFGKNNVPLKQFEDECGDMVSDFHVCLKGHADIREMCLP